MHFKERSVILILSDCNNGFFIVQQSNKTSNLLEELCFRFKRGHLSDTHIILALLTTVNLQVITHYLSQSIRK